MQRQTLPTVFLLKRDGGAGKSMGRNPPVPVVADRHLELSVFPNTGVPKTLSKTSINSKFASMFRNARGTKKAHRSVRLSLLFVKNKACWHAGPQ